MLVVLSVCLLPFFLSITARSELRNVLFFGAISLCFFVQNG